MSSPSSPAPRLALVEEQKNLEKRTSALGKRFKLSSLRDKSSVVDEVAELKPDLVLVDYKFVSKEKMSSLVRRFKEVSPRTPVLLVVTRESTPSAATGWDVADLIVKPFTDFELSFRIDRCLEAARSAAVAVEAEVRDERPLTTDTTFRDPESGRLDARLLAEYMDVPLKKLAVALDENYKALHKSPAKATLQDKLSPLERILTLLSERFAERGKGRAWLNTPHPDLGGRTALAVILEGHISVVHEMLEAAALGLTS